MKRRTFLAGLIAVPVVAACDTRGVPPERWTHPALDSTPATTEVPDVATMATLDEWHYVGEAGEPAFQNSWTNGSASFPALAFRTREAEILDIFGYVDGGTPNANIFVLPVGYRPGRITTIGVTGQIGTSATSAGLLTVDTLGNVYGDRPVTGHDRIWIHCQIFLTPPDLP